MNLKLGVLVFARMSSSRLPGKALMKIGDYTLIERVFKRASSLGLPVALATSTEYDDDVLCDFVENLGFEVYRGPLENVLKRSVIALQHLGWDYFFRMCGDRPFFDLDEINYMRQFLESKNSKDIDLMTNTSKALPKGLMTELVSTETVKGLLKIKLQDHHKEHMTSFLYENPEQFNIIKSASRFESDSDICLAMDTHADYKVLSEIAQKDDDILLGTETAIRHLRSKKSESTISGSDRFN